MSDPVSDPVLVLLHAFPLDRMVWDEVLDPLSQTGTDLIVPDLRGFGQSRRRPAGADHADQDHADETDDDEPDLEVMAREVLAGLNRVGARSAVLAGLSMGGYVAMALLRLAPDRFVGLALLDTRVSADTPAARADRLRIATEVVAAGDCAALADAMVPALLGPAARSGRPELVARVHRTIAAADPAAVAWAQRAMAARPDSTATLAGFAGPALVLRGAQDAISTQLDQDLMLAALPAAEPVVLGGSGHLSPLEQPVAVAAAIGGLLDRVRRSGDGAR
ncbi:MAG TPA: alpha/beta hydrolase [Candidatus Nanopelagicales bacterium]|nr:alpha/beta hydrolase [Candidatus Nanopelagicales bacterium]